MLLWYQWRKKDFYLKLRSRVFIRQVEKGNEFEIYIYQITELFNIICNIMVNLIGVDTIVISAVT